MRIKCPECQAILDAGTPKPGKYRPRCKHCGHTFFLKVTDDTPPKVGIGRDPNSVSTIASQAPTQSPTQVPATAATAATAERTTSAMDATLDSTVVAAKSSVAKPGVAKPGVAQSVAAQPVVAPTRQRAAAAVTQVATVDPTKSNALTETIDPSSAAQATIDTAVSGDSRLVTSVRVDEPKPPSAQAGSAAAAPSSARPSNPAPMNSADESSASEAPAMPARLGGYKLLRMLGRGAMGAVYEAKQLSLDRTVALKTIRDRLTGNPSALARFTREAYAAAQLNHHNVVQIYDFGEEAGQHYFSMERVVGAALDDVVRSKGPVEARVAATYVLQAARGLLCAHQSGMVHRDVKPANLLLSNEGVVKVADLGLVKVPDQHEDAVAAAKTENEMAERRARSSGTSVTMMGTAIGTPAYMAPEQFSDATTVDHRADIYSLGCTLYYLIVGKPPYGASEISALSQQHCSEPIPHVSDAHPHVPADVDRIIQRAMAKQACDRYPTLAGMISDLETLLGISSGNAFAPSAAQADAWAANADAFQNASPLAKLRPLAGFALGAGCLLLLGLTPWLGLSWMLLGPTCFVTALVVSVWLQATHGTSPLADAARQWIESLRLFDWIYGLGVVVIIALAGLFAGTWLGVLVGGLLGAILGAGYHYGLRAPINASRRPALDTAEQMIRQFRLSGADEDGVRTFVARYSKRNWGELFDALFGVDARMKMQTASASDTSIARLSLSLQDRVIAGLHARAHKNIESRDQHKLSQLEQRALVSEGVSAAEARDRAWQMAAVIIDSAKLNNERPAVTPGDSADEQAALAAAAKRQRIKDMMAEARSGKYAKQRDRFAIWKRLFGAQLRLALGVVLLAIVALWAHRTGMISSTAIQNLSESVRQGSVNFSDVKLADLNLADVNDKLQANAEATTMFGARWPSVAIAGVLLVGSAFVSGWLMTPFAILSAIIAIWGNQIGVPHIGPIPAYGIAAAIAILLMVPGAILSERQ